MASMDFLSEIFLHEGKSLVKRLADRLEDGPGIGSFSPSVYDTAWLSRICTRGSEPAWLFPQCFEYLLQTQEPGGGWPAYASETDGILNTMAATIALKEHQMKPELGCCSVPADLAERILKAEEHLKVTLQEWNVACTLHVGFEILVPSLLECLEKDGEPLDFPGRQMLMHLNQCKLSKFRPELLYVPQKTTLVHSLEAFVDKIDFDRVAHHLDERGSMMASPAATAAYLMHRSTWDETAEAYLRNVVMFSSGTGSGGVPSAFPSSIFEIAWTISTLLRAELTPDVLGLEETAKIRGFLQLQLEKNGGVVGFNSGLLPDADDTAKAVLSANLLGFPVSPQGMVQEFEASDHFRTYRDEQTGSFSANCNVLDALLHCPSPAEYSEQIAKVSRFLCKAVYAANVRDKWNLSERYSMMLLSQSLIKLLQSWDSDAIGEMPEDLMRDQVPVVLFGIFVRTLQTQSPDGSWNFKAASCEVTAYAVLTLKAISSLPWLAYFQPRAQAAIKRGSAYLVLNHDAWDHYEHIWVEKVTYALPTLSRAYCVAALCAKPSYGWGDKMTNLVTIPSDKVRKLAKFFSQLPMFSEDELWLLEADVALGCVYQPQLLRVNSSIFPRQEALNYKYLEYIPFTWIATNRKNHYPLSNNMLWDMMIIALLDYQLDEFMETLFEKDEELEGVHAIRSMVRELCKFDTGKVKTDDDPHLAERHHSGRQPGSSANGIGSNGIETKEGFESDNFSGNTTNNLPCGGIVNYRVQHNGVQNDHVQAIGSARGYRSAALSKVEAVLRRFTSYILQHTAVVQTPKPVRRQLHIELETCILAHIDHDVDNARFATQMPDQRVLTDPPSDATQILPFASPRGTYYSWVRTTSADNTHSPFTFQFFSCIAAAPGEPFFPGVRQHYLSNALSRHLANLCRQYNDYGSVARDQAERNLNSLNFPEFHEPYRPRRDGRLEVRDEAAMKRDLFFIAEYERECLDHVISKLNEEMRAGPQGEWKTNALRAFIDTVDLYGQIYVARDITNRVK